MRITGPPARVKSSLQMKSLLSEGLSSEHLTLHFQALRLKLLIFLVEFTSEVLSAKRRRDHRRRPGPHEWVKHDIARLAAGKDTRLDQLPGKGREVGAGVRF